MLKLTQGTDRNNEFCRQDFAAFATGAGHKLNNLSAAWLARVEIMQHLFEDEGVQVHLRKLELSADRTRALAKLLVEFNQKHQLDSRKYRCTDIAENLGDSILTPENICVSVDCRTDACIDTDLRALTAVLLEIIANSQRSIDGLPGTVAVNIDVLSDSRLPSHSAVCIDVIDSGAGFSDDGLELAFQPFYTTYGCDNANGLGLTLVRFFMAEFDGFVDIGNVDCGAIVRLVFPAVR